MKNSCRYKLPVFLSVDFGDWSIPGIYLPAGSGKTSTGMLFLL